MAHVEYRSWLRLIKTIAARYLGTSSVSIVEVGGGTAALGRMLRAGGFTYRGSDFSFAMCREALKKGLSFFCADARHLPLKTTFDFIVFLYDGINYLLEDDDYALFFGEACRCLRPGGLLLFDVTTEANSLKHFYDFLDHEDFGDYSYVRHSYYEPKSQNQYNDFTIFLRDNNNPRLLFEKRVERHVQRVLSVGDIRRLIPEALFAVVGVWDSFSFKRYAPRSERIHFLLRKKVPR